MDEPALYDLEVHVLPHLLNINQADPAVRHCLEEARTLLHRAQEILQADPPTQYEESQRFYRALYQVLPPMAALESPAPQPLDPGEEENSPDTPSSVLSSQDIFEPVTPSRQSES